MFSSECSLHSRLGMPVVRSRDDDGIDVFVEQEFPVIGVGLDIQVRGPHFFGVILLNQLFTVEHALAIQVCHCHYPGLIVLPDSWQIVFPRYPSTTNLGNVDVVAGCIFPKDRSGNQGRDPKCCSSQGCFFHKISSLHGGWIILQRISNSSQPLEHSIPHQIQAFDRSNCNACLAEFPKKYGE